MINATLTNAELAARATKVLMNTYGERKLAVVRGQGIFVWDADGRRYLDFLSGIAVNNLGHCHPAVVAALKEQAETLIHASNFYLMEPQIRLAELLVERSFADKVFFANSGAEANEGAIKLARRWSPDPARHEIICFENSFHGRTLAALSATGQKKYHQQGYDPLVPGFVHVPFNDLDAVAKAITPRTCGILVEPIQGESGVRPATREFLAGLRELADRHDLVLIYDEVQCGMGRTGRLFAYEHYEVAPDVLTLAKALGGGAPIGAILANARTSGVFAPGTHAHTFGGNPLVCAAALAALPLLSDAALLARVRELGEYFKAQLLELQRRFPVIVEVRGVGLMVGAQLSAGAPAVVEALCRKGILANCAAGDTLRFLPPLVVQKSHIDEVVGALEQCLSEEKPT